MEQQGRGKGQCAQRDWEGAAEERQACIGVLGVHSSP